MKLKNTPQSSEALTGDDLMHRFWEYQDRQEQLPRLSYDSLLSFYQQGGKALNTLLGGGDFNVYLRTVKELDRQAQIVERTFPVATPEELFELLNKYTNNEQYAGEQVAQAKERVEQARGAEDPPDCIFGVTLLSGYNILPTTVFVRKMSGLNLIDSYQKNPYFLFENWGAEKTKAFWKYIKRVNSRRSIGETVFLSGE